MKRIFTLLIGMILSYQSFSQTTLVAGDIAFTGYMADQVPDEFSFIILRSGGIASGTVINFTECGWDWNTSALGTTEFTVTWTSASAISQYSEVRISGLTASTGSVTGTAFALSAAGDQVLAYQGTAGSPTFISAIHMNAEIATTGTDWDALTGTYGANKSGLPPGLTNGVNAFWFGATEIDNAVFNCVNTPYSSDANLRSALYNSANWTTDDALPAWSTPAGCASWVTVASLSATQSQINVSCYGEATGSATVVASDGTPSYTYTWTPSGGSAATATGLVAGDYTCTINDAGAGNIQKFFTISQPASALSMFTNSETDLTCNGASNGAASVQAATGGTGSYTYDWTPGTPTGDGTTSITGLTANLYTCTVTDANSCSAQQIFNISQPSAIGAAVNQTNVSCNGGSNGSATILASGGSGSFTYTWSPSGGNTATATGLTAGNYMCFVVDAMDNTCFVSPSLTITEPDAITASSTSSPSGCAFATGSAEVFNVVGGDGNYSYSWTPGGATSSTITNVSADNYTCIITDGNGCTLTKNETVASTSPASISLISNIPVSCLGGSDGYIEVMTTGGTGTISFNWTPGNPTGDGTATITGLVASSYTVTVTDDNGCVNSDAYIVSQPLTPGTFNTLTATPASVCNGGSSDLFASIVPAPTSYCQPATDCTYPDAISNVTFGGINRSSMCDNGIDGFTYFNTPNPVITAGVATPLSVTTDGDAEGVAVWIDYDHSGTFELGEMVINGFDGNTPANYTTNVSVPLSALNGETRMRVRGKYNSDPSAFGPCADYQYGETEDYLITIVGGTNLGSFVWSPSTFLNSTTDASVTASNVTTTTEYTVNATSAAGCQYLGTLSVAVNEPTSGTDIQTACDSYLWIDGNTYSSNNSTATHILTNAAGCDSVVTLNLTMNYSTASTDVVTACDSYIWIDGNTYSSSNNTAMHTLTNAMGCDSIITLNLTINNSTASNEVKSACETYNWNGSDYTTSGTYTYNTTNAMGCDSTATLELTINYANANTDVQTSCGDYTWIDGNTYSSNNNTAMHTLTNAMGCDSVITLNLTVAAPTSSIDTQIACDSYMWIDGNTYSSNNNTATHTLTNAMGCDSVVTLDLIVNYSTSSNESVTACDTYNWNGSEYTMSGTYTYNTTNAMGCDSTATLELTINNATSSIETASSCTGDYTWNGNVYTMTGVYTFNTTNAAGCDSVATLELTIGNTVTNSIFDAVCQGLTYNFGAQTLTDAGVYTETFTSAAGCDSIVTLTLTINPLPNITFESGSVVVCGDAGANFEVQADGNNTYQWYYNEVGQTPDLSYIIDGSYGESNFETNNMTMDNLASYGWGGWMVFAQVTDAVTGCSILSSPDTITTYDTDETDLGDVTICADESYDFYGTILTDAGDYTHTLVNQNGCDSVLMIHLFTNPVYNENITAQQCEGSTYMLGVQTITTDGTYTELFTSVQGCDSTVNLTIDFVNAIQTTMTASICDGDSYFFGGNNLTLAGDYTDTQTSMGGCDSTMTLTLVVNPLENTSTTASICDGDTYMFDGNALSGAGTYTATFPNMNGCDSTVTLELEVRPVSANMITDMACDTYTINGETFTMSGVYTQMFTNAAGCDSILTLDLMIQNSTTGMYSENACGSTTINGETFSLSGMYTQTLTNAMGCDSIITLDLMIGTATAGIDVQMACDEFMWIDGNTYNSSNNSATYTLTNAMGCDSIVTLDLTVNYSNSGTDVQMACDEFMWIDGNTYNSSNNTATYTLTNAMGCDSTVSLDLTMNYSTVGMYTETACGSASINGETYTMSGMYTQTLTNAMGCDSILTVEVTINEVYSTNVTAQNCEGTTYMLGSQSITTDGTYTELFTSAQGCDSMVTVTIDFVNTIQTTMTASICDGDSYFFGGNNLTMAGDYTDTNPSLGGCDSVMTLTLVIKPLDNTNTTASICDGDSYMFDGNSLTAQGQYTATYTNMNGCDSTVTLDLEVRPTTTATITDMACDSYTINGETFTMSGMYTQMFTNAAGCDSILTVDVMIHNSTTGMYAETACGSAMINGETYTMSGMYTQTLTNAMGCDSILTVDVTINNIYNENVSMQACASTSVTFGTQTITSDGTYTELFTSMSGCDSTVNLTVTFVNTIMTYSTASICDGDVYTFDGNSISAAGDYTSTYSSMGGCDSTMTLTLVVNSLDAVNVAEAICDGDSYMFDGNALTAQGQYVATFPNMNGCDSTVTLDLTVNMLPVVTLSFTNVFGSDLAICGDMGMQAFDVSPIGGVLLGNGITGYSVDGSTLIPFTNETYIYNYTDANGCYNSASLDLFVDICTGIASNSNEKMQISPNPTEGLVRINTGSEIANSIKVTDAVGKVVYTTKPSSGTTQIDLSEQPSGIYFINVDNHVTKVSKQ